MESNFTRRAFVAGLGATLLPATAFADVPLLCPGDPTTSNPTALLTIDTHAHVFNGSDLQVRRFLSKTTVHEGSELYPLVDAIGALLQGLAWHLAPGPQQERKAIARYAAMLKDCEGDQQLRRVARDSYQEGYDIGRSELRRAAGELDRTPGGAAILGPTPDRGDLGAAIDGLPKAYEKYEEDKADGAKILGSDPTVRGYIEFVLHQFNHRHVNAIDYLTTYSKGSTRKIDLLVASMVDYDYWLAGGSPTATSLSDQVDLMGEVSLLLGGRVHGFAPFCPFRETVTRDPATGIGDSMKLVKRAIETRGFIGVKLYPPMGFAPRGNAGKPLWKGKPLPAPASDPDFGARLDSAMETLFRYCIDNDVPVMAHSNHSNGPYPEFEDLAGSEYWKLALEKFPGLRVSFGHFGDSDLEMHVGDRTRPFLHLMTKGAGTTGANTFADSGYFAGTLMNQPKMRDVLLKLYQADGGIMLERLMYGTDWTMILPQKHVERYLSDFIEVMQKVEAAQPNLKARNASITDAFFGRNAAEFLGLRKKRRNRERLENFYARNGVVAPPDWMAKVDAIGPV